MPDYPAPRHFLENRVLTALNAGELPDGPVTRFPPEPNGFLHIGHAKSICLNFGLALRYGGRCHLRFDDTNPEKEEQQYLDAIQDDVRWLGFEWDGPVRYTSSYFEQLHDYALHLIRKGLAYVCDLTADEARSYRGTLTEPGQDSPYRERSPEENERLFAAMRAGEFDDGHCVLRAKIDMASPNINLRDPILYRIRQATHHQTGDAWCIYPTYDFAHGQSDAIEGITHSLCTLEFEDHRPLYDWLIENLPVPSRPRQTEFARLNLNYTITSKRKLKQLVDEQRVAGWDDPRMPTIAGMRRRGYPAAALRNFCDDIGVARAASVVDVGMLEAAVRSELNATAPRAMAVLRPLKLTIENLPEAHLEWLEAPAHPDHESLGQRQLPFTADLVIEADDFRPEANKKYKRLVVGKRVRLRNAHVIEATRFEQDDNGEITQVYARIIPDTLGQDPADGIKPKGVIHWVSASHGSRGTVRLYDRLFSSPSPEQSGDFMADLNPDSLSVLSDCYFEPSLAEAQPEQRFQFERTGYFVADRLEHRAGHLVFNRSVGLRDTWQNS